MNIVSRTEALEVAASFARAAAIAREDLADAMAHLATLRGRRGSLVEKAHARRWVDDATHAVKHADSHSARWYDFANGGAFPAGVTGFVAA